MVRGGFSVKQLCEGLVWTWYHVESKVMGGISAKYSCVEMLEHPRRLQVLRRLTGSVCFVRQSWARSRPRSRKLCRRPELRNTCSDVEKECYA